MITKIKSLFDLNQSQVKKTEPQLQKIKALEESVKKMTFQEMKARISEMKDELSILNSKIPEQSKSSLKKIDRSKGLPALEKDIQVKLMEFMPEVYAFINEIYRRKLGFTYHDVQLSAAIILAQGQRLVELYTGEGKTMTFQLPLFLYALAGRGAHLVTVNDYLSKRDGEYAGHIATELGLSVGIVASAGNFKFIPDEELQAAKGDEINLKRQEMKLQINNLDGLNLIETEKRNAYRCDITYGTNNEFGFDYLRDNMVWDVQNLAQRELYFCIIDEADSILIDEARTPLIISGVPSDADTDKYSSFASAVKNLDETAHYIVDHKTRSVSLTEDGIRKVEENLGIDNLWKDYSTAYHIENALKAHAMFKKDEEYLVKNGEVLIVDEFTGRVLKGRRYSEGLHQAIEAKEGVEIKQENKTFATITFQNYFRLYKVLCGGSGTVMTEAEEFFKIYGLESVPVPTNKPVVRKDFPDQIYKTQEAKFNAVVKDVIERNQKGQPVLIGTTSVDKSEIVSNLLDKAGIKHEVLNAKYHEQEAKIIAEAGKKGAVTVATNMAGRGADIVIGGGSRGDEAWQEIADLGGLHVIGTERHEARRIDNQLRGRTGRQGEPGSSRFYVSLEDQLMKILGMDMLQGLLGAVGMQEDMPIELRLITRQIETAQKRIESLNFDSRKRVVDYDDVMNQHREIFYTRRRNILRFGDEVDGKFLINGDIVIANNNPEFESKILDSKLKLKNTISNIYLENLNSKLQDAFEKISKIDEKSVDSFIKELVPFLPAEMLANAMGVRTGLLQETLRNKILELKSEVAISDFVYNIAVKVFDLKVEEYGNDFYNIAKVLTLQEMDNLWVDHLELMKDVREGISLQSYAQKDPLVEYKNEAFGIFDSFIRRIDNNIASKILNLQKVKANPGPVMQKLQTNTDQIDDINTGSREFLDVESTPVEVKKQGAESAVRQALKEQAKRKSTLATNAQSNSNTKTKNLAAKEYGRNDKVSVRYSDGRELKDVKFKKVEADVLSGLAKVV